MENPGVAAMLKTGLAVAVLFTTAVSVLADPPNLVPEKPAPYSPHYWCTWYAQNYWVQRGGEITNFKAITNPAARETLTHHNVFNKEDGWAHYLRHGREDLTFLIDHGWQVKKGEGDMHDGAPFLNLVLDAKDFPQYANKRPEESLRLFNEELKALGWRGLGLWVRGFLPMERAERYMRWSKHAGVTYWKIDGGDTRDFIASQAKEKVYPELILEHAQGPGHFNGAADDPTAEDYPSSFAPGGRTSRIALHMLRHTDIIRTYDVAPHLITATTLRRIQDILRQTNGDSQYEGILNTQDLPYASVGMGTALASKRHPNYMERTWKGRDLHHQLEDHRKMQFRMNEVERLGRWSRIALPIPAGVGSYVASKEMLVDYCLHDEWSTWNAGTYGKTLYQNAPAVMARNMPLPVVKTEGARPYVIASTYPNGATAIATEGRCTTEKPWFYPRAKVTVEIKDAAKPIGIVGHYGELVLVFAGPLDGVAHVWAQDLLATEAEDIKGKVTIRGEALSIPGELIDEIGTSAQDKGDISAPGVVLRLGGESLPVAGNDFAPKAVRVTVAKDAPRAASADEHKVPYGYRVKSTGISKMALKPLPEAIVSGKATIAWRMRPANDAPTKNGFLVLSNDPQGPAAILAGSWIGANQLTIFENTSTRWSRGDKSCNARGELECKAVLDMDARTVTLTINGTAHTEAFSETMPNVGYIGFATQGAETLFTEPEIRWGM